ncbi:hypothetical protein Rctr197k_061 [Virus Rctr197k]|nr:hypothetical protein Rctr197k_061 [Virus Rctr197k]
MQRIKRNQGCIPGYWAPDPHARLDAERTADKVKVLLEDQLRTNGRPIWVWQPVLGATAGTVPCTCDKETAPGSDFKCLSCYGMRYIPGYQKFLTTLVYFASAEYAGYVGPYPAAQTAFTLTGTSIDVRKKPHRLQLNSGLLTGTIVTPDKTYTNPGNDAWELELAAYRKTAGDTITLEYSINAGTTWTAVTLTAGPLFGYRGALTLNGNGNIRFRVTLTRVAATTESPSFEILRMRHIRSLDANPLLDQRMPEYQRGQILLIRTWDQEMVMRDIARGRVIDALGDRSMTAPLDFFDTTIVADTPEAAFDDREAGPHPLFEYSSGVRAAQRYAMYAINIDSTLDDVMSHQSFSERRMQPGELYSLVF